MDLSVRVTELMEQNRRHTNGFSYTIPSPELYPFQWLWDSCFHAIILSHIDIEAAKAELRAAVARPLPNGLLPHIIYWERSENTKTWGRELRGDVIDASWGVDGTSSITQPPIIAKAVWRVYEKSNDRAFLEELYGSLSRYYNCLMDERTYGDGGLVCIINPDESGEDNAPRFDRAQHLPPRHSAEDNLVQRIRLMREQVRYQFDTQLFTTHHFSVLDVSFNVIYHEALHYMERIADLLGDGNEAKRFHVRAEMVAQAIESQLCSKGMCYAFDAHNNRRIQVKTWNMFMPLYGGLLSNQDAKQLIETELTNTHEFWTRYPIPTVALSEESYDDTFDAFWRGLVWAVPNWFLYKGLVRYGYADLAAHIKKQTTALVEMSGFREHYHPHTGEGFGAHNFTWGALVLDME